MAIDAALLEQGITSGECWLRFYTWEQPTLSLGHFQRAEDLPTGPQWEGVPWVRRLSGGGAILHDRELTYSLVIPAEHPWASEPRRIYDRVHTAIVESLTGQGVPVQFRGQTDASRGAEFLCFGRGDAFDLVLGGHKVVGSAQRRRKGVILQHGSLILDPSSRTPQFFGINSLRETAPRLEITPLATDLSTRLAPQLGVVQREPTFPAEIMHRAVQLQETIDHGQVSGSGPARS